MDNKIYRDIAKNSPVGYAYCKVVCDNGGKVTDFIFLDVNDAFEKFTNLKQEKVIDHSLCELDPNPSEDRDNWIGDCGQVALNGIKKEFYRFSPIFRKRYHAKVYSPEKGFFVLLIYDAYESSMIIHKLKSYFNGAPYGVFVIDNLGHFLDTNDEISVITGYERDELLKMTLKDICACGMEEAKKCNRFRDKEFVDIEKDFLTKEKHKGKWHLRAIRIDDNMLLGFAIDITELKQSQKALLESEARFKSMIELSSAIMLVIDPMTRRFVHANPAALDFYGWSKEEMLKKTVYDLNIASHGTVDNKISTIAEDKGSRIHTKHKLSTGEVKDVEIYSSYINIDNKKQYFSIIHDITEQVEAEQEKIKNQDRLIRSQEIAKTGSWEYEIGSSIIWVSDQTLSLFGCENGSNYMSTDKFESVTVDEDRQYAHNAFFHFLRKGGKFDITYRLKTADEKSVKYVHSVADIECDENGKPRKVLGVIKDITEEVNLQRQKNRAEMALRNQQKLESIGTLASGVAHEINNPVNGILNYGQIILDSVEDDSEIKRYAEQIIHETNRVTNIVRNLLDFSKQTGRHHSFARIEDVIAKTLSLIHTILKHDDIELNVFIDDYIPKVKCRSQQIQQVLMNLLTNARDAINEKYPEYNENKKINLECRKFVKDDKDWISISVEDYGMGIEDDVIANIFDPFFTTKSRDKGTGLGLSISYGIVQEHKGEILVDSKQGQPTKFTVNLPCDNGWEM